ncbi:MAG: hypothetical protein ACRDT6_25240 [Micromonosporaceae bacterium]
MSLRAWRAVENGHRPPGPQLLDGIVRSLQLDETEQVHLRRLAHAAASNTRPRSSPPGELAEAAAHVVAGHTGPAYAVDHRWRVIAANAAVQAAAPGIAVGRNLLRWFFKDPRARRLLPDWEQEAVELVGMVRAVQALHPHDDWYEAAMTRLAKADQTAERLWNDQTYISPLRPVSAIRVRCGQGGITEFTATRVQPAAPDYYHGVQIVLLS